MRKLHGKPTGPNRWFRFLVGLVAAGLISSTPAMAGSEVYYAQGKAYRLNRSTTEFGVKLHNSESATLTRGQTLLRGVGSLERLEGARPTSRYRILRAASADRLTRDAARAVPGIDWVRPVYRFEGGESPLLSTGRLVARLVPGLSEAEIASLFDDYGLAVVEAFDGLGDTYILRADSDPDEDEIRAAAALYRDDRVLYAHPDFVVLARKRQVTAEDEFFTEQWHLNNTGQDGATPGADIEVLTAWETTQGEDVRVGMLDDCCDVDHEDLRGNYLNVGQDIDDGDDDPRPAKVGDRHGTSVMGLICATANNDGVRGVAPNARFTASRGLGFSTFADTASAYTFARQQGLDIHNNSWGYGCTVPTPDVVADAIRTAFEDGRGDKGMVILFAAGNEGMKCPLDISSLPTVIAVGSTNAADRRSSYSEWGEHLDIMAPSNAGDEAPGLPGMVTTDNTDDAGYAEPGYNDDGINDFGMPNLSNSDYTNDFGGTSAACPVAAGVAALIISVNPELTATQVRLVLEHTAEQVSSEDALYDGITSRSNQYGYGRINAARAVEAATQSKTNGNLTWPDRVSDVRLTGDTLRWDKGAETKTILIVRSDNVFTWIPTEGESYAEGEEVTPGATVVFKDDDEAESYEFDPPDFGTAYLGIYAQNNVGRYSWGVGVDVDSDGNLEVTDAGPIDTGESVDGEDDDIIELPINENPKVSITVSPRSGVSPLAVAFQGNALTDSAIASTEWDFGDESEPVSVRDTTHTYTITDGRSHRYIATFTVVDEEGDVGARSMAIDVEPDDTSGDAGGGAAGTVQVVISSAADNTKIESGYAPLEVRLTLETDGLPGVFSSVLWDLGDGTQAETLTVLHTYQTPGTFPIQAIITTCHAANGCATSSNPGGTTYTTNSPVKFIDVFDSGLSGGQTGEDDSQADQGDSVAGGPTSTDLSTGGDAAGGLCGLGMTTVWLGLPVLALVRRRIR